MLVEDIPGWLGQLPSPLLVVRLVLDQLVINKYVVEVQLLLNLLGRLPLLRESSTTIFTSRRLPSVMTLLWDFGFDK